MITVVDYDPAWPERFESLRAEYAAAMAAAGVPVVAIEHVGSTSVPGLAAKPIIDIDIVVREADVAAASGVLMSLGFTPEGDLGVPERWAFRAPARLPRTNTYVIVDGCLSLRNHLAVRDVLRADKALRDEYAVVKKQAGARLDDIDEYVLAKNGIVQKILTAAGLTDAERASIAGNLWSQSLTRRGWLDEPGGGVAEVEAASAVEGFLRGADALPSVGSRPDLPDRGALSTRILVRRSA